jgi:hypothetical protein
MLGLLSQPSRSRLTKPKLSDDPTPTADSAKLDNFSSGASFTSSSDVGSSTFDSDLRERRISPSKWFPSMRRTGPPTLDPMPPPPSVPPRTVVQETIPPEAIPATIRSPLIGKLTIELPVDQLCLSSLQSRVVFAIIEDEMDAMDADVAHTEQGMEELENAVKSVARKTQNLRQTAEVVRAKAQLLDGWIEAATERSTAMKGAHIIEYLMWAFTVLTTVLQLLWTRDHKQKR